VAACEGIDQPLPEAVLVIEDKDRRLLRCSAIFLWFVPLLVGCVEGYSAELRYPLRSDPILEPGAYGDDPLLPDRPGDLPVMNFTRLADPTHILHGAVQKKLALDPAKLQPQDRSELNAAIEEMFGTPAAPRVAAGDADTGQQLHKVLKLDDATLAAGSKLYRQHCLHCHGLTGDGRGPTAFWINPHPRDYRLGKFKFVSSDFAAGARKPMVDDLVRTVRQGLDNTAMPSFSFLPSDQIEAMIGYVIHLSLRGEVENDMMTRLLKNDREWEGKQMTLKQFTQDGLVFFGKQWLTAQDKKANPDAYPYKDDAHLADGEFARSVKRGWKLYLAGEKDGGKQPAGGATAPCFQCHVDYGRKSLFKYDEWGTLARPANLVAGTFRGGRRPADLYWRIYNGIPGTGMPSSAAVFKDNAPGEHKLWDLVNFLQVLPYGKMRDKYGINIDEIRVD
jgi:hypothetical protein